MNKDISVSCHCGQVNCDGEKCNSVEFNLRKMHGKHNIILNGIKVALQLLEHGEASSAIALLQKLQQ